MELLFIGFALLIITLVGHALWEMAAWVCRGFAPRRRPVGPLRCPRCAKLIQTYPCPHCAYSPGEVTDVLAARKVIARLVNKGLLDAEVKRQVEEAIASEMHARLSLKPAAATVQASPTSTKSPDEAHETPVPEAHVEPRTHADLKPVEIPLTPAPMQRRPAVTPPAPPTPAAMPPKPVPPPHPPRKPFAEIFKAFLEEKNIRWGELIGGLLIVGCSIALVISLWAQISERPFLKVGVFTSVVAGLFGLGLYADRKWKLPSTSWGILLTAVLMVPLHFCAMVVIGGNEYAHPPALAVEAAGVILLACLTYLASGVICRNWRVLITGGTMLLALAGPVLYVTGVLQHMHTATTAAVWGGVLIGAYVVTSLVGLWQIRRAGEWTSTKLQEAASILGVLLFAAVPSLIMHAWFGGHIPMYWKAMAPEFALGLLPILAGSAMLMEKPNVSGAWRTSLLAMGLLTESCLLIWVGVAFPMPASLTITCVVAVGVLSVTGWIWRQIPQLIGALVVLLLAYLVALPAVMGRVGWMDSTGHIVQLLWTAKLGIEIVPGAILLTGVGWLVRKRETTSGLVGMTIGAAAGVLGLVHLLCTVYFAGQDVAGAWVLFGLYGAAAIATGVVASIVGASVAGTALLVLMGERLLGHGSGALLLAILSAATAWILAGLTPRRARSLFAPNVAWTLTVGAVLLFWRIPNVELQISTNYAWWITGILVALFMASRRRLEFVLMQAALAGAVVFQLVSLLHGPAKLAIDDTRLWVACGATMICLQGAWSILRQVVNDKVVCAQWSVDRVIGVGSACAVVATLILCVADLTGVELWTSQPMQSMTTALQVISYPGTWLAILAVIVVSLLEWIVTRQGMWLTESLVGVYATAALVAVRCNPTMAATMVRMSSIVMLLLLSPPVWFRQQLASLRAPVAWIPEISAEVRRMLQALVIAGGMVPLLALTLLAAAVNLDGTGPKLPAPGTSFAAIGSFGSYITPLVLLALVLAVHAIRERSSAMAMLACGVVHLTVTLGYMLQIGVASPGHFGELMQVNAIAAGLCAWVWLLVRQVGGADLKVVPAGIYVLAAIPTIVLAVSVVLVQGGTFVNGHCPSSLADGVGSVVGWVVAVLASSLIWRLWHNRIRVAGLVMGVVALGTMLATLASRVGGPWLPFHVLLAGHVLGAWGIYLVSRMLADRGWMSEGSQAVGLEYEADEHRDTQGRVQLGYGAQGVSASALDRVMAMVRHWVSVLAVIACVFALRAEVGDPDSPWWTVGSFVTLAALAVTIAQRELRPSYLYRAAAMMNLAMTFLWASQYWTFTGHRVRDLVMVNVLTLAASGLGSLVMELQVFRKALGEKGRGLALHATAAWTCASVLLGVSYVQLMTRYHWAGSADAMLVSGAAAMATLALVIACFWDGQMRQTLGLLYITTLGLLGMGLDLGGTSGRELIQIGLISVIGLNIAWGIVLRRWDEIATRLPNLGASACSVGQLPRGNAWLGLTSMMLILVHECVLAAMHGKAEMSLGLIITMITLLLVLTGLLVAVALQKVVDPLVLPFAKREMYVYLAEGVLVLLGVHLRLTCPELFGGFFMQFWPIAVMVLAFALAGLGEVLTRRGVDVVAGPVGGTAFILPLLPVLFFGALHSQVDYGVVLMSVAFFYGLLAVYRRSYVAGMFALIAANGALWSCLWDSYTLGFARHPQLWLIPPALSMIAASYLAKGRLSTQQQTAMRYSALLVAYASSTADIFLIGVANAPWLAGVLALLSVIGVLVGMLLRIRSFLYTGTAFLVVSLITLIYHASVNLEQTWLMWLSGIGLGVLILLAFAMFEKHKGQILQVLDDMRGWEV